MKILRVVLTTMIISSLAIPSVFADEVAELKAMVLEMRKDYESQLQVLETKHESRVQMLEEKIGKLEVNQSRQVEQKVAQMKDEIKEEIKGDAWNSEYLGRYPDKNDPSNKGGFQIETPSGLSKVTVGGYMDHEYEDFQNTNSTFDQHRYIFQIGAQIGERIRLASEVEIEHGGPNGNVAGDGEVKMEYAYLDYLINDMVNMRAGLLLIPFGRTNLYHDSDLRDLTERPLVAKDIIPTTWYESGAGFFGDLDSISENVHEDLAVNYEFYVINGLDDGFTDTGMGGARGSIKQDNNNDKSFVGRVVLSPAIGHEVGISGYYGKYDAAGKESISGTGVDWLSTWGPLEFVGEWARFKATEPEFVAPNNDIADEFQGLRLQTNYHFWPEFLNNTFLSRSFEDPTFTLVTRYEWAKIDDDSDADVGDNEEERYILGLNYRPVESWVMKFEYIWSETDNEALEKGDNNGFIMSVAMGF